MAVLVSRHDHALLELLWRWQRGELRVDIPVVISNHADLRESVERFGVRFEHVAIDAATHAQGEAKMLADRKSVVEGKSVSVRVDLGGRRIIKKTNKK